MNVVREGFLSALYLAPSNEAFENAALYRLRYQLRENGSITIKSAADDVVDYATLADFRHDWDMERVAERYRKNNPTF